MGFFIKPHLKEAHSNEVRLGRIKLAQKVILKRLLVCVNTQIQFAESRFNRICGSVQAVLGEGLWEPTEGPGPAGVPAQVALLWGGRDLQPPHAGCFSLLIAILSSPPLRLGFPNVLLPSCVNCEFNNG